MEEKVKACPLPDVLTFKGARRYVMEEIWRKADELERKGIPLTHEDFSRMMKEEWDKMKKEVIPKAKEEYEECLKRASLEKLADEEAEKQKEDLKKLGVKVD